MRRRPALQLSQLARPGRPMRIAQGAAAKLALSAAPRQPAGGGWRMLRYRALHPVFLQLPEFVDYPSHQRFQGHLFADGCIGHARLLQQAVVGQNFLQTDQGPAIAFAGGGRLDLEQAGDLLIGYTPPRGASTGFHGRTAPVGRRPAWRRGRRTRGQRAAGWAMVRWPKAAGPP